MFITDVSEMLKFQSNHLLNFYSNLKPILYINIRSEDLIWLHFVFKSKIRNIKENYIDQ